MFNGAEIERAVERKAIIQDENVDKQEEVKIVDVTPCEFIINTEVKSAPRGDEDPDNDLLSPRARSQRLSSRQAYWRNVAIGSILLGCACIWLSQNVQQRRYGRYNRHYSRR